MNQARREAYQNLIESLLTCPSEQKIEILQANLELIDDGFAQYLREWVTETLATLDAKQAYNCANFLFGLAISFHELRQGSRTSNLEVVIACLEIALTVVTREAYSKKWAMFQLGLGTFYVNRIRGKKADNLELAIVACDASLEIYTRDAFPIDNAQTLYGLGVAYRDNSQLPEAYNTFNSAIETMELMRSEIIIGGEADRQKLAEAWNKLDQALETVMRCG